MSNPLYNMFGGNAPINPIAQLVRDAKALEAKDFDILIALREEKKQLTQELIEHGCRRKN